MYKLILKEIEIEERKVIVYGIGYNGENIDNVSLHKDVVAKLINLCNELELDVIHIQEVVEDFIASCESLQLHKIAA